MREHNALATAGGAGGEEDHGQILGGGVRQNRLSHIFLEEVVRAEGVAAMLEGDAGDKAGAALPRALSQGLVLPVVEQHVHIGPLQAVTEGV